MARIGTSGRAARLLVGSVALVVLAFSSPAAASTFTVDSGADLHDMDTSDGVCNVNFEGPVLCTLRAAVEQANALSDVDEVHFGVPDVALTLASGGAIEITSNMSIAATASAPVTITQESSPGSGDRVFDISAGASVALGYLTIRGGEANAGNAYFGGNIRSSGTLTIADSSIESGSGDSAGGVANVGGSLTISRSTVAGNKAPTSAIEGGDAGAVLNFGTPGPGTLVIDSSTISGNRARLGGGVTSGGNSENSVTITNSTIAFNESGDRGGGGGILIGDGTATIRNTIVARNTSLSPGQANCSVAAGAVISSGGYNLENDSSCGLASGTDRQNADPVLEQLALNGGTTRTHALGPGSQALDTGDPGCPVADQRGFSRPLGRSCDTGAFESIDQSVP